MPMVRVFTKTDIGNHAQIPGPGLDRRHRTLHDSIGLIGPTSPGIFAVWNPEEHDPRHTQVGDPLGLVNNLVHRKAAHSRHRSDGFADPAPLDDEEGKQ